MDESVEETDDRPRSRPPSARVEESKDGDLDSSLLAKNDYVANNRISIADYFGVCLVTAGELIHCGFEAYPNVRGWVQRMKKLGSWPKVNEVLDGFAASLREQQFQTV